MKKKEKEMMKKKKKKVPARAEKGNVYPMNQRLTLAVSTDTSVLA